MIRRPPLGDFSIEAARVYISKLQGSHKWEGHPFTPGNGSLVSAQTIANHVRVLKGFATWLFEEGYTEVNNLARLSLPKAPRKIIEILTNNLGDFPRRLALPKEIRHWSLPPAEYEASRYPVPVPAGAGTQ